MPSSSGAPVPTPPYANATLSARDGSKRSASISAGDDDSSICVNVYLPPGIGAAASSSPTGADTDARNTTDLPYFYRGSRFEGGSMIGPIVARPDPDTKLITPGATYTRPRKKPHYTPRAFAHGSDSAAFDTGSTLALSPQSG
mgnify:CR=1 FL=1